MRTFKDYLDNKHRIALKQLNIVKSVLEHSGLQVVDFMDNDGDPYIFCHNSSGNRFFDGVRIYSIGGKLAYRVQKEETTHPFGKAYSLDIEEMFDDFLKEEDIDEKRAGKMIIEELPKGIRKFFERSAKAEREIETKDIQDKEDKNIRSTTGTDYSSQIYQK